MAVKERKRGRPSGAKRQLSAEAIVVVARRLLVADAKVPSIRRVAGELAVDAMAIYHYFPNKAKLLEAVTVDLIEDIYEPTGSGDWRGEVAQLAHSYLQLLKDHGGLLETLLSMSDTGPAQVFTERFRLALKPLALDEQVLGNALDLLVDYLHGFALALHCQSDDQALPLSYLDGPLGFYFKALAAEAASPSAS